MANGTGGNAAQQLQAANDANMAARAMIIANGVDMSFPLQTQNPVWTQGQVSSLTFQVKPTGLLKRLWIKVTGTITVTTVGATVSNTAQVLPQVGLGFANFFSNIQLLDPFTNFRINTSGWHIKMAEFARRMNAAMIGYVPGQVAGAANATPEGLGGNIWSPIINCPATVTQAGGAKTFEYWYEIPVAYSDHNLSGSIWAGSVEATISLSLQINPNFIVNSGITDNVLAGYVGSANPTAATMTGLAVTVYQNVYDQVPRAADGSLVLPALDLQHAYMFINSNITGLTAGQTQQVVYTPWRNFLSTFMVYDNNGVLNTGSDVTQIAIQTANAYNLYTVEPHLHSLWSREKIGFDWPAGTYFFDTRDKPIKTLQYGQMSIAFTPLSVGSTAAQLLIAYEMMAPQGMLMQGSTVSQS
jgi:hypothetical protein